VKKRLLSIIRFVVPAAILAYLAWTIGSDPENRAAVAQIFSYETHWWLVLVGFLFALSAISLTFMRWYYLVVGVGIPFTMKQAFRLGFLGYLLNFVGAGGVGGDLFKAYILAKDNPDKKLAAFSTIVMDRMIGLYALFFVSSVGALSFDLERLHPSIRSICIGVHVATVVGLVGMSLAMLPGFSKGSFREFLEGLPKVGGAFERVFSAIRMYQSNPKIVALIGVQSLGVHTCFAMSVYCIASAMFENHPTIQEMLVIAPLAMLCAALPISPGGMGTLELALTGLYVNVPTVETTEAQGITVALAFRVFTLGLAFIGAVFYWTNRDAVDQNMAAAAKAEEEQGESIDEDDESTNDELKSTPV